ncbi:SDR family oxidoreductase [Natronolimnohabitans innermongolicus]|uniref:Short-chain dehydrogenase/reductase SDR n=1 Tax=Natronolimnohabitans innermongolicus JCM 12255 TaxID=1227499 RepID=L9WRZ9_9EURY|nr:SDR family oxidoreductase [Natronolimnohabitans innermongolicus]ELY52250.1 short-chain dehydrogenase/reductase SDR [Natronolimnohabitans innermongolicus JCM 12255]
MAQNETVLVTGGTRGIGRAVAEAFTDTERAVVIGDRDGDAVTATVEALEDRVDERGGSAAVAGLRTDVRDQFDLERLAETASRTGDSSGVNVVVPAAAVRHGDSGATPLDREPYSAFDDHWRYNARGVFGTIREALPHCTDDARILVPTASADRGLEDGDGSYAVSRTAVEAVARGFAADTEYTVGCLSIGRHGLLGADDGERGTDRDRIATLFVRAATEIEPADIDGEIVDLETWSDQQGGS